MSVLSYCEMALYGISESLQHSNIEFPEETTQLCSSLHVGLCHAIALSCKVSANAVLKRRNNVICEAKSVIRLPQLTRALRYAHLGNPSFSKIPWRKRSRSKRPFPLNVPLGLAKKHTTLRYSLPTQGGTTREAPLGQNLGEMLLGLMVPVGGQPRGGSEGT
jgi:hypothetical protein